MATRAPILYVQQRIFPRRVYSVVSPWTSSIRRDPFNGHCPPLSAYMPIATWRSHGRMHP
jgi:hypothetical protein